MRLDLLEQILLQYMIYKIQVIIASRDILMKESKDKYIIVKYLGYANVVKSYQESKFIILRMEKIDLLFKNF